MQTIRIEDSEVESIIKSEYGGDTKNLLNDFIMFIKERHTINGIKKGFDEVKLYEKDKIDLKNVDDFISELKSAD
jgi:hypothetical protein